MYQSHPKIVKMYLSPSGTSSNYTCVTYLRSTWKLIVEITDPPAGKLLSDKIHIKHTVSTVFL